MSHDNIVEFDPKRLQAVPRQRGGYCFHYHVFVCEKTRMLECQKCGQVVDPFDFMYDWAIKDRNLERTRDSLKKDISMLREELEELKKDERNTRARLKRLKTQEAS